MDAICGWLMAHDFWFYRCDDCGRLRPMRLLRHEFTPDTHLTAERCGMFCRKCQS